MKIYTIGFTTRSIEEFVGVLKHYKIEIVADVRRVPKSKYNKQFEGLSLENSLVNDSISYIHIPQLGSAYYSEAVSENPEWRNKTFRGYAEYIESNEFVAGLDMLKKIASKHPTVILCLEANPALCHRHLIADVLTVDGWEVQHIMTEKVCDKHKLSKSLRVEVGKITYSK